MPLTADEILRRSAEVYASCSSYRDEGIVSILYINGPREFERHTDRRPFRTLFVRPAHWRFEFWEEDTEPRDEWNHLAIWTDRDGHHSWWTVRPHEILSEEIRKLLAGANGVSGGSARTIPRLLASPFGRRRPPLINDATLEAEEMVHGSSCHRITGNRIYGEQAMIWIECDTFLIRRLFHRTVFDEAQRQRMNETMRQDNERRLEAGKPPIPDDRISGRNQRDFTTETTTDYHPLINTPIDPAEFHFTPPV